VIDPETQDEPLVPRKTLKLKKRLATPPAPSPSTVKHSPAAAKHGPATTTHEPTRWIDENKRRMQAEMDALGFGTEPNKHPRGRT
jgi:hypothetical protein